MIPSSKIVVANYPPAGLDSRIKFGEPRAAGVDLEGRKNYRADTVMVISAL